MFHDNLNYHDPNCHIISFVDGHDNLLGFEIASYADFTGNAEVEISPILYSTDMMDGVFKQKQVDLRFLTFIPIYFNHEFETPIQYLSLIQNSSSITILNGSTF